MWCEILFHYAQTLSVELRKLELLVEAFSCDGRGHGFRGTTLRE